MTTVLEEVLREQQERRARERQAEELARIAAGSMKAKRRQPWWQRFLKGGRRVVQ